MFFLSLFILTTEYDLCPCLVLPESFKSALSTMLDVSLLKDPVFMLIGISNMFGMLHTQTCAELLSKMEFFLFSFYVFDEGMAGLYVPFVYLVDAAKLGVSIFQFIRSQSLPSAHKFHIKYFFSFACVCVAHKQGIPEESAPLLLSIIGITNTFGRVICGYVADFPSVDSLLLNNLCLVVSTLAVASIPLCSAFWHYVVMSVFFGLAICM